MIYIAVENYKNNPHPLGKYLAIFLGVMVRSLIHIYGIAILLDSSFEGEIVQEGNLLIAPAGKHLSAVCAAACQAGLTGLEFAWGIPGSIGGAVYMNAGAYGGELKDRLVWVESVSYTHLPMLNSLCTWIMSGRNSRRYFKRVRLTGEARSRL